MLLFARIVTIAISRAGLVPSKIVGFGIEFANIDRSAILWLLASSVVYFVITFLSHALPEFISWMIRYRKYWWVEANVEEDPDESWENYPYSKNATDDFKKIWHSYEDAQSNFKRISLIKIWLDLGIPIIVGLAAVIFAVKATCFWC